MPPHGEPTCVFWGVRHERAEYGMAQKLSVADGRDDFLDCTYRESHAIGSMYDTYSDLVQSTVRGYQNISHGTITM